MGQAEFFAMLGAPLNNPRWSWGAVRDSDRTVFLKAWTDEIKVHAGREIARVTFHSRWRDRSYQHGYRERLEHLDRIMQGAKCYLIMCEPVDKHAPSRRIKRFDSLHVRPCGQIISVADGQDTDEWIEIFREIAVEVVRGYTHRKQ